MEKEVLYKVVITTILALGAMASVAILGYSIRHRNDHPKTISVKGSASRDFVSDLVVWELQIEENSDSPSDGLKSVDQQRGKVLNFLKEQGIPDTDVQAGGVSYYEMVDRYYDSDDNRMVHIKNGFKVQQTFTITSKSVDLVEQVTRNVGDLIGEGVKVTSYPPRYYYTQLAVLKLAMAGEASADAYARAEQIAAESGDKLNGLKTSNMGVFQILGKYSDEDYSWGGTLNTSSKEKTVTITVSSVFLVK